MNNCIICGEKVKWFSKKVNGGHICKNCISFIPKSIVLSTADPSYLRRKIEENLEKANMFETTASYEGCYLDSTHGLFCVSKGKKENPSEFHDIYHITELKEIGLYCCNIRNIGVNSNKIVCDIKIRIRTEEISNDFTLASGRRCDYKSVGNGKLECKEPDELTMFRNMFNQMIDDALFNAAKKLQKIQELNAAATTAEGSVEWARGVFFLDKNEKADYETVKARRNVLVKIFHPDMNSEYGNTEIAAQINTAYKILNE